MDRYRSILILACFLFMTFSSRDTARAAGASSETEKHSVGVSGGQLDGTNRVFAAALRSPKGQCTWIIVNDAPCAWPASLRISGATRSRLYQYQVTAQQKDNPNLKIAPARKVRLKAGAAAFDDELPAMSLTIYSSYKLGATDQGVIAE